MVANADIYKMLLGRTASSRKEALEKGVLVFGREKAFHEAVLSGERMPLRVPAPWSNQTSYLRGGAKENAYRSLAWLYRHVPRPAQ